MQFVNNWQRTIELAIGATAAAIDLPNGSYRLTITDGENHEIIGAQVAGGNAVLTRGLEGTAARAWPAESVIYCALTAGSITEIFAALADLDSRVSALEPTPHAVVTSAAEYDQYGYVQGGGDSSELGSISPAGARAIPGSTPSVGADGEILQLVWHSPTHYSYPSELWLVLRGTYANVASLPFTTLIIDGVSFSRSSASLLFPDGGRAVAWSGITANPLPVGARSINFA